MVVVKAYAAMEAGGDFQAFEYEMPGIEVDQVEIEVESCGICHSDLSMRDNEWEMTEYPFVGGHEVIGKIAAKGENVPKLNVGDRVGLGWFSRSCMHCDHCIGGDQNLCLEAEGTISHQMGGFADRVRCHWAWAVPIPDSLPAEKCGPLLCGGITVFNPIVQQGLAAARVGVVGIGGLGHMAVRFLRAWGCEVTAFSRGREKEQVARELGAHHYVATGEDGSLEAEAGKFDMILNTTNAMLPWDAYVAALAPKGILHTVGAAPKVEAAVFPMIVGQKSLASSPLGSIATTRKMIEFCVARHDITPDVETFAMNEINAAFDRVKQAPPLRVVLTT